MVEKYNLGLRLLEKLKVSVRKQFLHDVVDELCERGCSSYQTYSSALTLEEWWNLNSAYQHYIRESVNKQWTTEEILKNIGDIPDEYKKMFIDVLNVRKDDIRLQLVAQTTQISQGVLTDFDWQVKLAMSSDKLATVQEPILSLDLDVKGSNGGKLKSVELNREDLWKMITSLEAANKAILQLKS